MAKGFKSKLKKIWKRIDLKICFFCSKSKFLSSAYYFFISSDMSREHQSVLSGKLLHLKKMERSYNNDFLLRRNIHRLEKGLIMRPLKEVFAESYIKETVDAYAVAIQSSTCDDNESLIWARDVLEKYFSVVNVDKKRSINNSFKKFSQCEASYRSGEEKKIPFQRDLERSTLSFEQFEELCRRRRSVRWFEDKKVPEELLDRAIMAATQAPSACNRQPYRFHIFTEGEKVRTIAELPMGTKGFSHNFPCVIAVVGDLSAFFDERDRHIIYIDSSLATMGFILALETFGLSSCVINWPDIEEREQKISSFLGLKAEERVIMLIAVGWPDKEAHVPFSQKKSINDIRSYN